MTTEQLYEVLDSLPKGYGRKRICFKVRTQGIGSASCQIGEMRIGDDTFFCIASDDGGDMFRSVDELKFRLSLCRDGQILFLHDKFWETPHVAECYVLEDGRCELDSRQDDDCGFISVVFDGNASKGMENGLTGKITWFDDFPSHELDDNVMMSSGVLQWMPRDGEDA